MGKIHELPKSSSRLLSSSQIISSVYCVVKELIENSLDSVSKNVEVKLEDYGLEKIEIKDNGSGIDKNDIQFVAKSHFTSKITSYSDLNKVETYGFRGEALGAICAVADLVMTTKSLEENVGCTVCFGHDGRIISTKPCPCAQGTTVSVFNLFKNIPVRKQYYRSEKNKKDDLRKVEDLLISYGCIKNDIRFALYHNKNLIWQKPALSSAKNALIHILGNSVMDHLKYIEHIDEQTQRKIEAYLPKLEAPLTCGLSSSSRCITSINKRPVRIKAIDKLLKEYYNKAIKNLGKARYPICYISFATHLTEIDVNVDPNKTTVILHHLDEVLEQFSELLKNFYNTDVIDENVNKFPSDYSLPIQEPKSNTSDSLDSLKVTCNAKIQQSNLTFANENSTPTVKVPVKMDCANTGNNPSLRISDNPMTKKDIIEVSSSKEPCKKKLKTKSLKKDIDNHISTLKSFFSSEEQANGHKFMNNSSYCINSIPSVTVQRNSSTSSTVSPSEPAKVLNGIDSGKITTFAVSSNICSNNNSQSNVNTARKRHFSDSSVPFVKLDENILKKPTVNVNGQNEDAWSCGKLSSGELIQPVTVLQPKTINTLEINSKKSDGTPERKELSHERKQTAFEIFCCANRLEVAVQNPKLKSQQIALILRENWNRLSPEEKSIYKNMVDKEYKQEIKKKENLKKAFILNLSKDKKQPSPETSKITFKPKIRNKDVSCSIEQIKRLCLNKNRENPPCEDINIINYLAPGIWVCAQRDMLYLLNTFRLQETVIYHRLLETFQFDPEPLETPQDILTGHIGEDAMSTLMQLSNFDMNTDGRLLDQRLTANGFDIRLIRDDKGNASVQLIGITYCIAFYGIPDLKELLLFINQKGVSLRLSECRPSKVIFYLQSEANRMLRQNPACQREQDVEDLLNQKKHLPANCDACIHHKVFFSELWKLNKSV